MMFFSYSTFYKLNYIMFTFSISSFLWHVDWGG